MNITWEGDGFASEEVIKLGSNYLCTFALCANLIAFEDSKGKAAKTAQAELYSCKTDMDESGDEAPRWLVQAVTEAIDGFKPKKAKSCKAKSKKDSSTENTQRYV